MAAWCEQLLPLYHRCRWWWMMMGWWVCTVGDTLQARWMAQTPFVSGHVALLHRWISVYNLWAWHTRWLSAGGIQEGTWTIRARWVDLRHTYLCEGTQWAWMCYRDLQGRVDNGTQNICKFGFPYQFCSSWTAANLAISICTVTTHFQLAVWQNMQQW